MLVTDLVTDLVAAVLMVPGHWLVTLSPASLEAQRPVLRTRQRFVSSPSEFKFPPV